MLDSADHVADRPIDRVATMKPYRTLTSTETFREDLERLNQAERNQVHKALALLDTDEKHPSLRVHKLRGQLAGLWSASASASLRMTFVREQGGRKIMMTCTRHYA
jgi:mRNA-degrading endonuclease YafQ of YafQ-DinJ toxin-antitoxin module